MTYDRIRLEDDQVLDVLAAARTKLNFLGFQPPHPIQRGIGQQPPRRQHGPDIGSARQAFVDVHVHKA